MGPTMQHEETAIDLNWGRSYETAKYKQILNPDAGQNLDPVEGLDGTAAESESKNIATPSKKSAGGDGQHP